MGLVDVSWPLVAPMSGVVWTRVGLLNAQVCVPKDMSAEQVTFAAESDMPSGTTGGWVVDASISSVQCADDPDRRHWILVT